MEQRGVRMSDEEKIVTHLTVNNQTRAIADSDSRSKIVNILLQLEGKIESGLKTLIKEEETARKSADAAINSIIGPGFKDSNGKVTSTLTEKITTLDEQMAGNKDSGLLTKINTLIDKVGDGFKDSSGKVVSLTTKISNMLRDGVKNPNALSFTGGSNVKYDGSEAKTVNIPTSLKNPYPLVINNNGGNSQNGQVTYDGSHSNYGDGSTVITMPTSLENPQSLIFTGGSSVEYDGSEEKTVAIPTLSSLGAASKAVVGDGFTDGNNKTITLTQKIKDLTDNLSTMVSSSMPKSYFKSWTQRLQTQVHAEDSFFGPVAVSGEGYYSSDNITTLETRYATPDGEEKSREIQ